MQLSKKLVSLHRDNTQIEPLGTIKFIFPHVLGKTREFYLSEKEETALFRASRVLSDYRLEDHDNEEQESFYTIPEGNPALLKLIAQFLSNSEAPLIYPKTTKIVPDDVIALVEFFHFLIEEPKPLFTFFKAICISNESFQDKKAVIAGLTKGLYSKTEDIDYDMLLAYYVTHYNVEKDVDSTYTLLTRAFREFKNDSFLEDVATIDMSEPNPSTEPEEQHQSKHRQNDITYYTILTLFGLSDSLPKTPIHERLLKNALTYENSPHYNPSLYKPAHDLLYRLSFRFRIAPSNNDEVNKVKHSGLNLENFKNLSLAQDTTWGSNTTDTETCIDTLNTSISNALHRTKFMSELALYEKYHDLVLTHFKCIETTPHQQLQRDKSEDTSVPLRLIDLECTLTHYPISQCLVSLSENRTNPEYMKSERFARLQSLSRTNQNHVYMRSKGIPIMLKLLDSPHIAIQRNFAQALRHLSKNEANHKMLLSNGLEIMIKLYKSSDACISKHISSMLNSLYNESDNYQIMRTHFKDFMDDKDSINEEMRGVTPAPPDFFSKMMMLWSISNNFNNL